MTITTVSAGHSDTWCPVGGGLAEHHVTRRILSMLSDPGRGERNPGRHESCLNSGEFRENIRAATVFGSSGFQQREGLLWTPLLNHNLRGSYLANLLMSEICEV